MSATQLEQHGLVARVADARDVSEFVDRWVPANLVRMILDRDWNYRLFPWDQILAVPQYNCFAAVAGQSVEGLIALQPEPARLKVAFLATAPWNFGPSKTLKGVGSGLLAFAVACSVTAGFGGELVLSSTPESETFYEARGLVRTGARDVEDLAIFVLSKDRAAKFLAEVTPFTLVGMGDKP